MLVNTGNRKGRREKQPIILTWQRVQEEYVPCTEKFLTPAPNPCTSLVPRALRELAPSLRL